MDHCEVGLHKRQTVLTAMETLMPKLEFELTVGDVLECGDIKITVVDTESSEVSFKVTSEHDAPLNAALFHEKQATGHLALPR